MLLDFVVEALRDLALGFGIAGLRVLQRAKKSKVRIFAIRALLNDEKCIRTLVALVVLRVPVRGKSNS